MLADDDPVIRMLVKDYLEAHGLTVSEAACGRDCLKLTEESVPDLLVLDFIMPDMNGIEVLKALSTETGRAPMPVIMLSADSDTATMAARENVHADRYLQKPFELAVLLETIRELMAGQAPV